MSYHGQPVIDMDTHIREYVELDRTYKEYMDPEYREAYGRLSDAVARRREAGLPTALFMNPLALVETSNEARPLGIYEPWATERLAPALALVADGLRRLHAVEGPRPANAWLHTGSHWHIEVVPRLTVLAGLELGAGIYVNTLRPEDAARTLRKAG